MKFAIAAAGVALMIAAVPVVFRRGFKKDSLMPGTDIVVDGYQAKDGSNKMNGRNLTLPNGDSLFLGSSGTGAPRDSTRRGRSSSKARSVKVLRIECPGYRMIERRPHA